MKHIRKLLERLRLPLPALAESGFKLDLDLCPRCKRVSPAILQAKALEGARRG